MPPGLGDPTGWRLALGSLRLDDHESPVMPIPYAAARRGEVAVGDGEWPILLPSYRVSNLMGVPLQILRDHGFSWGQEGLVLLQSIMSPKVAHRRVPTVPAPTAEKP